MMEKYTVQHDTKWASVKEDENKQVISLDDIVLTFDKNELETNPQEYLDKQKSGLIDYEEVVAEELAKMQTHLGKVISVEQTAENIQRFGGVGLFNVINKTLGFLFTPLFSIMHHMLKSNYRNITKCRKIKEIFYQAKEMLESYHNPDVEGRKDSCINSIIGIADVYERILESKNNELNVNITRYERYTGRKPKLE